MYIELNTAKGIDLIPVESRLLNAARVLFLDKVSKKEVDEITQSIIYLLEIDENREKPITIFVRANEGEIDAALVLCDYVKSYADRIVLIAQGTLSFAASLVFIVGESRKTLQHTKLNLYDPAIYKAERSGLGFDESFSYDSTIMELIESSSNMTKDEIGAIKNEINAKQAKKYGLVDEIMVSASRIFNVERF